MKSSPDFKIHPKERTQYIVEMKDALRDLVYRNGFKGVYEELMLIATECITRHTTDLAFIDSLLEPSFPVKAKQQQQHTPTPPNSNVMVVPLMKVVDLGNDVVIEYKIPFQSVPEKEASEEEQKAIRKMKVIRKGGKFIPVKVAGETESKPTEVESSHVTESESKPVKRTPKEMKRWQLEQEGARRRYMSANNIKLEDVMTKEKVEEYISRGHSGSSIRREYSGQSYEEWRAWCRANGVKSSTGTS